MILYDSSILLPNFIQVTSAIVQVVQCILKRHQKKLFLLWPTVIHVAAWWWSSRILLRTTPSLHACKSSVFHDRSRTLEIWSPMHGQKVWANNGQHAIRKTSWSACVFHICSYLVLICGSLKPSKGGRSCLSCVLLAKGRRACPGLSCCSPSAVLLVSSPARTPGATWCQSKWKELVGSN